METWRDHIVLYVNGTRLEVRGEDSRMMLAPFLRRRRQLTGTKIVCAEGDCGACSVLRYDPAGAPARFEPINACIVLVAQLDGCHIVSVEGLAATDGKLSAVQEAVVAAHGAQCGYCTPGFVVALTGMLQGRATTPSEQTVKNHLTGNLCRCTGYAPLIKAGLSVAPAAAPDLAARYMTAAVVDDLRRVRRQGAQVADDCGGLFHAPTSLAEAVALKARHPDARLLAAGSDLGVVANRGAPWPEHLISLHLVDELRAVEIRDGHIVVGARVTLSALRRALEPAVPEAARFLDLFASPQIKNVATLVGNVANGSPIADTLPLLMVLDGAVRVVSAHGARRVPLTALYRGYRDLALSKDELISHVELTLPAQDAVLRLEKVSQRKDLDIAAVNAAFYCEKTGNGATRGWRIAYGGVGPTVTRCPDAEAFLEGRTLDDATVAAAVRLIEAAVTPRSDLRGSAAYREQILGNLFQRFCARGLADAAS